MDVEEGHDVSVQNAVPMEASNGRFWHLNEVIYNKFIVRLLRFLSTHQMTFKCFSFSLYDYD